MRSTTPRYDQRLMTSSQRGGCTARIDRHGSSLCENDLALFRQSTRPPSRCYGMPAESDRQCGRQRDSAGRCSWWWVVWVLKGTARQCRRRHLSERSSVMFSSQRGPSVSDTMMLIDSQSFRLLFLGKSLFCSHRSNDSNIKN